MLKRILCGAGLALAVGLIAGAPAQAAVATFEGQAAFRCDPNATEHDGGLTFDQDHANPFFTCFYSPGSLGFFPTTPPSTVMAVGFTDTTVTTDNGRPFDLDFLDLAAGYATTPGDTTFVQGFVHGGGLLTATLGLGTNFHTYVLNWTNLDSVVFSKPQTDDGYVAFDNVSYQPIPEPATWGLMLLGFTGAALMLRRARQLARTYTA